MSVSATRIAEHVKFFDHIVQLFPSSYYTPVVEDEGGAAEPTEVAMGGQNSDSEDESTLAPVTPVANRATSMSELREKLQAKVKALGQPRQEQDEKPYKKRKGRKSRKLVNGKEEQTVKKQKLGNDNKAGKASKTTEEKGDSKPKTQAKKGPKQVASVGKGSGEGEAMSSNTVKAVKTKKPVPNSQVEAMKQEKPKKRKASNADVGSDLMFSSVIQDNSKEVDNVPGTSKKNVHRALQKVLHFEEKVKELKQQDPLLAHEVVKQASFAAALNRAQGNKVHDDKARLAKALKRKEKSKKKSQKEWNERTKKVTASKMEVAQKRTENVKAKLEERSAQRLKKSIKKRGDVRALLAGSS